MFKRKKYSLSGLSMLVMLLVQHSGIAQQIQSSKEQILVYTSLWKGERFPDGRPKVSDDLVKRLANISLEEAWAKT